VPMTLRHTLETPLKYRPDIDGLRALAVLSVVIYHLGLPLHGGYVGVDIFFTISGFLIGSIILRQTADHSFTFVQFYERRIRRIFPALFVMLFVCLAVAYRYFLPVEFSDFATSMVTAALSVSNIYFYNQTGYFDSPSSSKPLLHTWSLAVEEQFYIFLPILLVLLRRFAPRRVDLGIYLIAAVSFLTSVYGAIHYPAGTFYLAPTRAWELLCGTMLALDSCPRIRRPAAREVAGVAGAVLIAVSVFFYRRSTPFPGLAAVPPCLGTALIIAAGNSGRHLVARVLSLRPLVFIGLISYSLYLWHWPLIVFRLYGFTLLNGLSNHQTQALTFTLSFVVAILSWRLVEVPFRTGTLRPNRTKLFLTATAAMMTIVLLSAGVISTEGAAWRFSPRTREIAVYADHDPHDPRNQYRNGTCFITSFSATLRDYPIDKCLPDRPAAKTFLLLGDSHAAALWWGFDQMLKGANVMQATASGCKPVLHQRPRQYPACTAIMDYALRGYLPTHHVDGVLIEAIWDDNDMASLGETLASLRELNVPVILFGPIVQYDSPLPRLLAMSISHNDPLLPSRHRIQELESLDMKMAGLAQNTWHVRYVSMIKLFCQGDTCTEYAAPDVPLQSDYGHLTKAGSVLAAQRVIALKVLSR
jgi:peptidoglycan/LPS O-acetylase OafA/YrhL